MCACCPAELAGANGSLFTLALLLYSFLNRSTSEGCTTPSDGHNFSRVPARLMGSEAYQRRYTAAAPIGTARS